MKSCWWRTEYWSFFDGQIIKDVKSAETNVSELGKAIAGKA